MERVLSRLSRVIRINWLGLNPCMPSKAILLSSLDGIPITVEATVTTNQSPPIHNFETKPDQTIVITIEVTSHYSKILAKAFNNPSSNTAFALAVSYPRSLIERIGISVLMAKVKKLSCKGKAWAKPLIAKLRFYTTLSPSAPQDYNNKRMPSHFRIIQTEITKSQNDSSPNQILVQNDPKYRLSFTIPGIGPIIAAAILDEIGNFSWFKKPKQLVAFSDINPSVYELGKFRAQGKRCQNRI